jgi:thiol-disulfide isomerase/thioredoxin
MTTLVLTVALQASVMAVPGQGYTEALNRSVENGRLLVILVGADWCPACVQMHHTILPEVARNGCLNKVEFAYVDVDREQQLAGQLSRGSAIPQLIRYEKTEAGWKSGVLTGAHSPQKVAAFINGTPEPKPAFPTVLSSWTERILGR